MTGQNGDPLSEISSLETIFAPVRSITTFEETVERLGTAIRLGLLAPGTRLPAERELCERLGIARSTLRQALTALAQSGHITSSRGRGGGTFVVEVLPKATPRREVIEAWQETCDQRMTVEIGIAALAAGRAATPALDALDDVIDELDGLLEDFPAYRTADVRLHVGLAQSTGSPALIAAMTEIQGQMSDLISLISHPPEILLSANQQHRRLLAAVRRHDEAAAAAAMIDHLRGTEHVLAGLMPPS
jgi:GntR family transcriptional regulator, transcriptional repressor for pyruvate dehydrogenase complex